MMQGGNEPCRFSVPRLQKFTISLSLGRKYIDSHIQQFSSCNLTMAPSRTSTVKSKHATNKSGIRNSKTSSKPQSDSVSKSKKPKSKGPPPKPQKSAGSLATLKKKRRVYTEKELDIPALNMITPIGVEKPKGKKRGKVFVDDRVCSTNFER